MAETVNEQDLFEESDFAEDQTSNQPSTPVEDVNEQSTSRDAASDSSDDSTANESQPGDDLDAFLANKGVSKDDPDALHKVAKMYRDVEKDYSRKAQEKAQLERQIAQSTMRPVSGSPIDRLAAIERRLQADQEIQATREWKQAKNLTPEAEGKMVDFLSQPIRNANGVIQRDPQGNVLTKYFLVQTGALSYDDVYRAVGGDSLKADEIKQNLKNAVANEFAAKQTAKGPSSLATNSTQFNKPKGDDDEFLAGLFGDD